MSARVMYTEEHIEFLRKGYKTMSIRNLTVAFNEEFDLHKSLGAIGSILPRHNITTKILNRPRTLSGNYRSFTEEQVDFIKREYKYLSLKGLTEAFNKEFGTNKGVNQLRYFITNHKISSGRTGCFEKGSVSWNKGLTGYMGPNVTSFKKGHLPAGTRQVGDERICSKDGYALVKVQEPDPNVPGRKTRWKPKHVDVWEKEHGPVPKGHIVIFLDGDKTNCDDINNLVMITRAVNAYLNRHGYADLRGEFKKSAITMAELIQKTSRLKKQDKAA